MNETKAKNFNNKNNNSITEHTNVNLKKYDDSNVQS